jgi:hypothetical protein
MILGSVKEIEGVKLVEMLRNTARMKSHCGK